jgi:hypothetical protein
MHKLGLANRSELIAYAFRRGVVPSGAAGAGPSSGDQRE